ncbi:MAG: T9SS type A sorting domain-containing protein [Ignavibacteria bacterium]|nr:T9SS type A sorting domain-containing protein [Ignavibacteria bacterium]
MGFTKDYMYAKFSDGITTQDTLGIIFDASPPSKHVIPIVKDVAGELTAHDEYGGFNVVPVNFAMRQFAAPVIIPLWAGRNITLAEMYWKRDFNVSYIAVVPIKYNEFQSSEQELVSAEDIVSGNVLQLLKYEDNIHAEIDSSTSLILKFKVNCDAPQPGMKRSYVLISSGRYEKPAGFVHGYDYFGETHSDKKIENESTVELLPNVPNPFNPVTIIRFKLPEDAFAEVSVFDITGKMIAKIAEGVHTKGYHKYVFDAASFSSGAYYVRLKTDNNTLVRRIMLVK